jgi:hypothetical protein
MSNYASLSDFNARLQVVKDSLTLVMTVPVKKAVNNLARVIADRVSSTGATMDGGSFSAYSAKHKLKKQKYGQSPYGKITNRKNFFLTGTMWDSYSVSQIQTMKESIYARVDFMGNNVFKSNRELNEIHSDNEFKGNEKQGIGFPNPNEELELVAEIEAELANRLEMML